MAASTTSLRSKLKMPAIHLPARHGSPHHKGTEYVPASMQSGDRKHVPATPIFKSSIPTQTQSTTTTTTAAPGQTKVPSPGDKHRSPSLHASYSPTPGSLLQSDGMRTAVNAAFMPITDPQPDDSEATSTASPTPAATQPSIFARIASALPALRTPQPTQTTSPHHSPSQGRKSSHHPPPAIHHSGSSNSFSRSGSQQVLAADRRSSSRPLSPDAAKPYIAEVRCYLNCV